MREITKVINPIQAMYIALFSGTCGNRSSAKPEIKVNNPINE